MKENVQSIERAFQILTAVQQRENGIGIGALATETGLHTSTTSRIVSTLEAVGALTRQDQQLFIGEGIIKLANRAPWTEQLISVAMPYLRELATVTQEAVGLTIVEGSECVVFYQIPSSHHIQIRDWTGDRFPLHVTSTGKLYLSELSDEELKPFFDASLPQLASETKVQAAEIRQEFSQIRSEGVAWTIDELEDGLTSIAATVQSTHEGNFVGLYLSMPSFRFTKMIDQTKLAQQVRDTAVNIKKTLKK